MARGINDLLLSDRETLLLLIKELQTKLQKKTLELDRARRKLSQARARMVKMKDTVEFQRKRIIELY